MAHKIVLLMFLASTIFQQVLADVDSSKYQQNNNFLEALENFVLDDEDYSFNDQGIENFFESPVGKIQKDNEVVVDYDDENDDDLGLDEDENDNEDNQKILQLESEDENSENNDLTDDDIQDLQEAKMVKNQLGALAQNRAITKVNSGSTTAVLLGQRYYFESHDKFGSLPYPNNAEKRRWFFVRTTAVREIVISCPHFKTEWKKRCKADPFTIFKGPTFRRGIRRCGQIHGFYKRYTDDAVKVVFKVNKEIRKSGFMCVAKGIPYPPPTTTYHPLCSVPPTLPPPENRILVTNCEALSPESQEFCTCIDIERGVICLQCSFCTDCDLQFFANHNFVEVRVYMIFTWPCEDELVRFIDYSFGFEESVIKRMECIVTFPENTNVIEPYYPNVYLILLGCFPASTGCVYLTRYGRRSDFKQLSSITNSERLIEDIKQLPLPSALIDLHNISPALKKLILFEAADLSTLQFPWSIEELIIKDTGALMFPEGSVADFRNFTSLVTLVLEMETESLTSKNIIINSVNLESVHVYLPAAIQANIAQDAIYLVTAPTTPPEIQIETGTSFHGIE